MAFQTVFKRYELKYMLSMTQKERILKAMEPFMELDKFGRTTIRNIYYDTDDYLLIRRSIDKPIYKEKLRVRSYTQADATSTVFVELKKKFEAVVYKRRISLSQSQAMNWLDGKENCPIKSQISDEIDYFMTCYQRLHPTMFISYEREAYYCKDGSDFRVTFDDTILCRQEELSLCSPTSGIDILPHGMTLMEIKCSGGIPLWMAHILSKEKIYKTSFSKYGTAYQQLVFPRLQKNKRTKETV